MNPTRWICLFLFAVFAAFASPPALILVNVDEANPPFMYGSHDKALGIYPGLINAAFKHMKIPVRVEAKPWKRALTEIENGIAGVGGIYKNSERINKYDYSDQLFIEALVVYFNTDKPMPFSKVEDLKGKTIGVLRGWSYGDDFDNLRKSGKFTVEEVSSDSQNFQKLASKRLDAVIAISASGSMLASKYKNIGYASTPLALSPTFLAFSKSSKRSALLKQFGLALKEMRESGEFQKIVEKELTR